MSVLTILNFQKVPTVLVRNRMSWHHPQPAITLYQLSATVFLRPSET